MLGFIVKGMKTILLGAAKRISKTFSFSAITGLIGKRTMVHLRRIGTKMLTNMKSAKWWSKALRYIRKSGIVSSVGNTGAALKQAGANNWITKGMSAFKYDARSPKDYHTDLERKTKLIETLKKKRDKINERALAVQDELTKTPLDTTSIVGADAKIDALSTSLNQMKAGLADVRSTSKSTQLSLEGFIEDQQQSNSTLGEVILKTSEGVMKVQLEGTEDMKSHNMAMHAETTENITSDITAHIDALEEQKKAEEEERRKNDWKRKFLGNLLLILEWVLDLPGKIKMLLIKIGLIIVAGLAALVLANLGKIKAFFSGSLKDQMAFFYGRLLQFISWINQGIEWVVDKILDALEYLDPTGLIEDLRKASKSIKESLGIPSHEEIRKKAKSEADAAMKRMEANYAVIEAQKKSVSTQQESVGKDINAENPGKSIVDVSRLKVTPPKEEIVISGGDEKPIKQKTVKPKPKPDWGKMLSQAMPGTIQTPLGADGKPLYSFDTSTFTPVDASKTTSKVVNSPSTNTATSATIGNSEKKETTAVTKEELEATAMALAKANKQTQKLVVESSKATIAAAGTKTPNVTKTEYNFKKESNKLNTALK